MRKLIIILLAITMLVVAVTACGGGGNSNLVGTWVAGSSDGRQHGSAFGEWIIVFNSDGTVSEDVGANRFRGTYETKGNTLTIKIPNEGTTASYTYKVSGSTLTLDDTTFTKQSGGSSSSSNNQGSGSSAKEDDLEFTFRFDPDTNGVIVTGYTGSSLEVTVPSEIDGQPVTSITGFGRDFGGMSITLPNTLVEIGENAFQNNSSLSTVVIPNSVTAIRGGAFRNSAISSITIPDSVTIIESSVFWETANLTSITIPNSVTEIGSHAFAESGLTSIVIPDSVTKIGDRAFYETDLQSIVIGNGVTEIGKSAFFSSYFKLFMSGGVMAPVPPPMAGSSETQMTELEWVEQQLRGEHLNFSEEQIQVALRIYDISGIAPFAR
ncbi:MAG: leucine-rich repeat protein [Oscillospiraceae bacterium]|nr:leucine-rich repeat protein [Oscillospiraceae bacterium]